MRSAAATSTTTDSATCATSIVRASRSRGMRFPGEPSLRPRTGGTLDPRSAGARPKSRADNARGGGSKEEQARVQAELEAVRFQLQAERGQQSRRQQGRPGDADARGKQTDDRASIISCRTMCPRVAPSASLSDTSRSREAPRASRRLARFAYAIKTTITTIPAMIETGSTSAARCSVMPPEPS